MRDAQADQVPKGPEEAKTDIRNVMMKGTRRGEWRAGREKEVQRRRGAPRAEMGEGR